jgi:hypothetical protein
MGQLSISYTALHYFSITMHYAFHSLQAFKFWFSKVLWACRRGSSVFHLVSVKNEV